MLIIYSQGDPALDNFLRSQDPAFMTAQPGMRSPGGSTYSTVAGSKPLSPRVRKALSPSNRSLAGSVAGSYAGSMPGATSAYGTAYGSAYGSMATGYDLGGGAGYEISEDEQKLLAAIQVLEAAMQACARPSPGSPKIKIINGAIDGGR